MANVTIKNGGWYDLGRFKSIKCKSVMAGYPPVCTIKFSDGEFVIGKSELKRLCKK